MAITLKEGLRIRHAANAGLDNPDGTTEHVKLYGIVKKGGRELEPDECLIHISDYLKRSPEGDIIGTIPLYQIAKKDRHFEETGLTADEGYTCGDMAEQLAERFLADRRKAGKE